MNVAEGCCLCLLLAASASAAAACPPLDPNAAASLSVAEVLARVEACHPDVRAARASIGTAAADIRTAGQAPNPQLTAAAGSVGHDVGNRGLLDKTFDHQLRIDQLIERGDKAALRVAAAEATHAAARADLDEAIRQARLATLRTYHDLQGALARAAELQTMSALYDESQRAIERRAAAGDVPALEVTRQRLDALRLESDRRQAEADARALQAQLATALGIFAQGGPLTPMTLEPAALQSTAEALVQPGSRDDVVDERPDVAAARARLGAARASADVAKALRTRDISVGLQVDRYPVSVSNTSGSGNTVSLSVTVPLLIRHQYEGEIARAAADIEIAEETLRRIREAARADHQRALALLLAARQRESLYVDELLPAAERVAAGAELAYRRGASSLLDVLDARRALRAVRIERVTAEAELAKAIAELAAATAAGASWSRSP